MAKSTEEILAQIAAIRQRVAERYPGTAPSTADPFAREPVPLADLMPLFEARDAADGKVAAIGKVNPRHGGAVNALIQTGKRAVARGLGWFIREQVDFNAAAVRGMTETIEALNEVNRSLATIAAEQAGMRRELAAIAPEPTAIRAEVEAHLRTATDNLSSQIRAAAARVESLETSLSDAREHLQITRGGVDAAHAAIERLQVSADRLGQEADQRAREREREDIRLLRTLADVQNASRQQWALLETELRRAIDQRGAVAEAHADAAAARSLDQAVHAVEASIHRELRLLRQRVGAVLEQNAPAIGANPEAIAARILAGEASHFDSLAFSERFRGSEADVTEKLRFYLPHLEGCSPLADLGCGRAEFLDLFRESGGHGIGVESNPELAAIVRRKGHETFEGDLFAFLAAREPESLGGIFCAHVIEHMPAEALLRLLSEAHRVLRPGGLLALETPNPACLAIFATYFFLDPTHVRPVPSEFVRYLLEETGFTGIQVFGLHSAEAEFPELKPLPEGFRQQFFGDLDYGVLAQKP